jgi:uncharacterized protein YjbJ (UPF0337 family)
MLTREELHGQWTQLKGKIRERWGQITDDELQQVHGDAEQFLGFLERKTGRPRHELENFVRQATEKGQSYVQQATDTAREYADRASQAAREGYETMEQGMEEGIEEAQAIVRSRPVESVAAAFGAGLVTGVLVSLLLRSSSRA